MEQNNITEPTKYSSISFQTQPILEDELLLVRPLREDDFEPLFAIAADPLMWEQHPAKERSQREGFEKFFRDAMSTAAAFAVVDKATGSIIGTSRYYPVPESSNAVEIGWTFLARGYWGGTYNGALKRLMMEYAFQFVEHVIFCIHDQNYRSQKAVQNIGATRIEDMEGILLQPRDNATLIFGIKKSST